MAKPIDYSITKGCFHNTRWEFQDGKVLRLAPTDPFVGRERFSLYYDTPTDLEIAKRLCTSINDMFHELFSMHHPFYVKNIKKLDKSSLRIFCDNLLHAAFVRACCMYEGNNFDESRYDRQKVIEKAKHYMNEFRDAYSHQSVAVCGNTRRNTAKSLVFNFLRQTESTFEDHLDAPYKDYKPRLMSMSEPLESKFMNMKY